MAAIYNKPTDDSMISGATTITCPRCGAPVRSDFKFCPNCGLALAEIERSPGDPPLPVLAAPAPERRQLTVMFCDLVGSVALSLKLDPEDLREVVRRYQKVATTSIEHFEGYIAQYLGDGILAYFGYPIAHEDEAERAVRAGREILSGINRLCESLRDEYGINVAVRIGVHTGIVVVGEVGSGARRENLALGEVPNVAARVQSLAPENSLVASEATFRLVARGFEGRDLGRHTLKGTDREERIFEIVDERVLGGPLSMRGRRNSVSGVGRDDERAVFDACWDDAENGRGRVLFLHGEPGIGKSHLVHLFRQAVQVRPHRCVDCRCSPYFRSTPFHPFTDWLRGMLNFYPEQTTRDRLEIIEFVVSRNELADPDAVSLLAGMLSVSPDDAHPDLEIAPSLRRERSEKLLAELFLRLSDDEPLLMVVEDVHWADPTSRSFLQRFAGRIRDRRVLILLTSRPRPEMTWSPEARIETIALHRLSRNQVEAVITEVAGGKAIPSKVVEAIIEKTDGIPLFVQELTRMVIESDLVTECDECYELAADVPELSIPATLHDSLMARLDRILPVKEVAQICSTIGREFSFELASVVSKLSDADLASALKRLVDAELLRMEGVPPRSKYTFRHALIQEAAYESVLRRQRQSYHERIAQHLINHPELEESRSEIIAFHLTRALKRDRAAHYWRRAGEEAYVRWANEEALDYFTRGLALLEGQEPTDEIRHDRFFLHAGLGVASMQLRGYTHPSVLDAFEKALAYADDLADRTLAVPAIRGIWAHYTVIGNHQMADATAKQLADLAAISGELGIRVDADLAVASTDFWRGEVSNAADRLERVLSTHADVMQNLPTKLLTQHPRVGALSYLSLARWYLGYPEQAEQLGREAVAFTSEIKHPFSSAFAVGFYGLLQTYLGHHERALHSAEKVLDVSDRYGFPFWSGIGTVLKAWATSDDDPESAILAIKQALGGLRQAGVQIWTSYPAALMADLMVSRGQVKEGLGIVESVAARAAENGEGYFLPELLRIHAKCLLAAGRETEADEVRRKALDLARRQQARPILLRILLDLADGDGDVSSELDTLLHATCDSFTEGLETAEIVAARRMISA